MSVKWIERISFYTLVAFSVFGAFVFTNFIHEASHRFDYHPISHDGSICAFWFPDAANISIADFVVGAAASYTFLQDPANSYQYHRVSRYTEAKALLISVPLFMATCFAILIVHYWRRQWKATITNTNTTNSNSPSELRNPPSQELNIH